ncbi:MAG: DUF3943 domain-containing protein [Woeseiaceae bacterium]|nr:DUF3943 domain-containing protein [Woeseiaceae bacterium]
MLATWILGCAATNAEQVDYSKEILCCGKWTVTAHELAAEDCCASTRLPDWRGRRSDTRHFFGYQFGAIALLYVMPESVSGWTDEQKDEYSLSQWWDNVTHPTWDTDDFYINYILHPYWGGAYFVRSRERGYGDADSFWYAAALSASYEFGAEALFEQPSIQDLIVTPVGGWFVGRYFMGLRESILAGHFSGSELPFRERFLLAATDPLGAINRTVDGWFGLDQRLTVHPYLKMRSVRSPAMHERPGALQSERVYGITVSWSW